MTEKIDLKQIERRAYLSYHQDGLIDIAVGAFLSVFGLTLFTDIGWLTGAMVGCVSALIVSSWVGVKEKVTAPRIGSVKFTRTRTRHTFYVMILVSLLVIIAAVLLVGVDVLLKTEGTSQQPWLVLLAENAMIVAGIYGAVLASTIALSTGIRRFYLYGLISVAVSVVGQITNVEPPFAVIAVGVIIAASGLVLLKRFLGRYPL